MFIISKHLHWDGAFLAKSLGLYKKSPTPLFALCELNEFENYLMLYTLTVELQVLARLVLKHLQAFSDCLRRENLMLMYCDLLRKIVS